MHLKTLLAGLSLRSATADMETEITRISYDSRTTAPGDVFVAMTGFATDGHAYIGKAVAAGAAAVVCERPPEDSSVPYVLVENSRRALAVMAANYYGHPADSMTMVAVTGTNGKTTTTYLLKAILEQELGAKVGLIGTNQDLIGDALKFVKENEICKVCSYNGNVFSVEPPLFVELEITDTEPGFKGDTATGASKPATVETGATVSVPLFVNTGDKIKIDTRTGEYLSRV